MTMMNASSLWRGVRRFRDDRSGAAAVEFAILASVLLALAGGAVDLIDRQTRQREVNRISVEVAEALAHCPDSDCVRKGVQDLIEAGAVVLEATPGAVLGVAEVTEVDGALVVLQGTMTYLPADVQTEARAVLENRDVGVAVLVTYADKPLMGLFVKPKEIRRYAVALRAKNVKMV